MEAQLLRRENGSGNIDQRSNGTWVGRIKVGLRDDGKPRMKYFSGKSPSEVRKKLRRH